MRRQLGIIAVVASLVACGGDSRPGDDEEFAGETTPSDAGVQRDASRQADAGVRAEPSTRPDAGHSGGSAGSTRGSSSSSSVELVFTFMQYIGVTPVHQVVTLFKDGWGCYDSDVLNPVTNLASHRASRPSDWFKWQRGTGGKLQRLDKNGAWVSLGEEDIHPPLTRGFSLSGTYVHTAVGGSLVFGAKVTELQFGRDLTFSVVAGGSTRRGKYLIDGYTITLTDASGRSEVHSFVGNTSYFWFDGARYMN